jgi:hypothetical protein
MAATRMPRMMIPENFQGDEHVIVAETVACGSYADRAERSGRWGVIVSSASGAARLSVD